MRKSLFVLALVVLLATGVWFFRRKPATAALTPTGDAPTPGPAPTTGQPASLTGADLEARLLSLFNVSPQQVQSLMATYLRDNPLPAGFTDAQIQGIIADYLTAHPLGATPGGAVANRAAALAQVLPAGQFAALVFVADDDAYYIKTAAGLRGLVTTDFITQS